MYFRKNDTVAFIVTRNFQAASVFNSCGVDFYSKGERTLEHACLEDNVPMSTLVEELWNLKASDLNVPDFEVMNLTDLSTYILRTHHKFTEKKLVFIRHMFDRLARETSSDKKLSGARKIFEELSVHLTVHMKHEEFIIFPFIRNMVKSGNALSSKFAGLENPIATLKEDHRHEASTLKHLAKLTNNYSISAYADDGIKVTYGAMKELEEDLKIHMHLENNILFPKAINLAYAIKKKLCRL